MYFDPFYLLVVVLPGLVLGGIATYITKTTFHKYEKYAASSRLTGAAAARRMLDGEGLHDVQIERVQGFLSDHYDPRVRKLRLSPKVYDEPSLSAIGVACHEAGHALQHAHGYAPLKIRTTLVPATMVGTNISYFFILAGMFMHAQPLIAIGALLFAVAVLFSIVTLPVEWDATARAKKIMVTSGIVTEQERDQAGAVLNAAFLTYVAAAVTSIITLLYYLWRAGLIGGRR